MLPKQHPDTYKFLRSFMSGFKHSGMALAPKSLLLSELAAGEFLDPHRLHMHITVHTSAVPFVMCRFEIVTTDCENSRYRINTSFKYITFRLGQSKPCPFRDERQLFRYYGPGKKVQISEGGK